MEPTLDGFRRRDSGSNTATARKPQPPPADRLFFWKRRWLVGAMIPEAPTEALVANSPVSRFHGINQYAPVTIAPNFFRIWEHVPR